MPDYATHHNQLQPVVQSASAMGARGSLPIFQFFTLLVVVATVIIGAGVSWLPLADAMGLTVLKHHPSQPSHSKGMWIALF
jgi:hypothetical protein